jgi:hypothetical protein
MPEILGLQFPIPLSYCGRGALIPKLHIPELLKKCTYDIFRDKKKFHSKFAKITRIKYPYLMNVLEKYI